MKKIAMVVFSSFPLDVRVRREAEAHIEAGNQVDVFCRKSRGEASSEIANNIQIYRLELKRKRANKLSYIREYLYFFTWAFGKLTLAFFKKKYDVIHIHNMPDFLVFTALIPKVIFGRKIILDLHDPMPELYLTMFSMKENHFIIRHLKWLEKICIKFANHVFTPNISFKNLFISRGCPPEKISIVMNSPDEKIFRLDERESKNDDDFIIMYHGAVVKRQGPDILLEAVAIAQNKIPKLKVLLYGDGNYMDKVKNKVKELNLSEIVELKGMVIVDEIAEAIKKIDLGVMPNRINPFTQINFPVRTFEYLVMNKPVIVPRTQGILDYFNEDTIFFFNSGDAENLAKTILDVYENPKKTKNVLSKSKEVFNNYRWQTQKQKLIEITDSL